MNANQTQVRDARESSVSRLRDGLEAGGFGQASVDVGQQGFSDARTRSDNDLQGSGGPSEGDDEQPVASTTTLSGVHAGGVGLVDHYV